MYKLKEILVVEGKDDAANIKRFVEAEIIITHGFGLSKQTFQAIQTAAETLGIIVFTDPDFAGEQIRRKIVHHVTGSIKHAYISREEGTKDDDIGVENASEEAIINALKEAKSEYGEVHIIYTIEDMYGYGLMGDDNSKARRIAIADRFKIGYGNGKQMLKRLNKYNINREELEKCLAQLSQCK